MYIAYTDRVRTNNNQLQNKFHPITMGMVGGGRFMELISIR